MFILPVANQLEKGVLTSPEAIVEATRTLMGESLSEESYSAWKDWRVTLSRHLTTKMWYKQAGWKQLHVSGWRDIAKGLNAVEE